MARQAQPIDEDVREEPAWRLPLIGGIILLGMSIGVLWYYLGPTVDDITGNTPGATTSETQIRLSINGVPFMVPENYTLYARDRRSGERDLLSLHTLFPEFVGFTARNADEFAGNPGHSRVVHIQIEARRSPFSEEERLSRIYMGQIENLTGEDGPHGLQRYGFRADSGYRNEELFVGLGDDGRSVVLRCFLDEPDVVSPSCRRDTELGDKLTLSYRFKRTYLEFWRDIDAGVHILVDTFRTNAQME
jgi:hypothetical protein